MLECEPSKAPPLGVLPLHQVGTASSLPLPDRSSQYLAEVQGTVIASLHLPQVPQFQVLVCGDTLATAR